MHPAREIPIGNFRIGGIHPLVLIGGSYVMEIEEYASYDGRAATNSLPRESTSAAGIDIL